MKTKPTKHKHTIIRPKMLFEPLGKPLFTERSLVPDCNSFADRKGNDKLTNFNNLL